MIQKIKAIEYNAWMSVLAFLAEQVATYSPSYGLAGRTIEILPAYPKDMTKFKKPSIVVQKIHTSKADMGFAGYMGQYNDEGTLRDVKGRMYDMIMQIDVSGDSNTDTSLLSSMLYEEIFDRVTYADGEEGQLQIPLFDYTNGISDPQEVGRISIVNDVDVMPMSSNLNDDYKNILRITFRVVQPIINMNSEVIDLTKPMKYTYKIIT